MDKIIAQMQAIVDVVVKDFKTDFIYDIDDLKGFKGCFFWCPRDSGTHLITIGMDEKTLNWLYENKKQKFLFGFSYPADIMKNQVSNFKIPTIRDSEHLYFYDGVGLNKVSAETAIGTYNRAIKAQNQAAIDLQQVSA